MSEWWISLKPATYYYYYYLSHFIAHGVLFDVFEDEEGTRENVFTQEVILPNIERVTREFGIKPLIVRHYPPDQTDEESFYWYSYPPHVNAWLVQWAQENNLPFKKAKLEKLMPKQPPQMFSWMNPKLEVRSSGGGKGVFTTSPVKTGERLSIFGGQIIRAVDVIADYGIQVDEQFCLDHFSAGDAELDDADFINHSCDPNAGIKGQIFLVAMRDIEPDEEVTFDYAMCLHRVNGLPPYSLECRCGKDNCRKVVTDDDWKLPELQQKYGGYFSWFLQEKIERMREKK